MHSKELQLSGQMWTATQPLESASFDRAIQAFLERRGQEAMPLDSMQAIDTGAFSFVQISHICYERERDCSDKNLLDFQQILSAAANMGGWQFAYLLDSDGQNLKLYLGIGNSTENVATESVANATFLRDTFAGIYAGSQCEVCEQNLFNLCSKISKLCTESLHSDKTHRQRQKTLCFDYRGRKPMNQERLINLYLKMK